MSDGGTFELPTLPYCIYHKLPSKIQATAANFASLKPKPVEGG